MEFECFTPPPLEAFKGPVDGVLLAGDTDSWKNDRYLNFAFEVSTRYGVPVVMVLGNHEFYGTEMHRLLSRQKTVLKDMNAAGADIHVLDGTAVNIGNTRIVGATLWTDFDLDPAINLKAQAYAQAAMNDFRMISIDDGSKVRPLAPSDTIAMHRIQKDAILKILGSPHDGPTIVMTHHMPIRQAVHSKYMHDPINAAFASDLLREIECLDFDVWAYGHSHDNYEFETFSLEKSRKFVSNPRGYPHEKTRFDPTRIIEV
jgi:predicted phosphodiesterase